MGESAKKATVISGQRDLDRREFIARTGTTAFLFSIMKPELVRGSQANSKIALGMIGCGDRGTWIADLFQRHGGYQLVAAVDYFPEIVSAFGTRFKLPANRCYSGLLGYRRMLEGRLDAVAIESPPYFHPEQSAAAVEGGMHVYLAKPVAVDVPGCQRVVESSRKASAKNRCFLVDFQTRTDPFYQDAVKRVQNGEIGSVFCGEAAFWSEPATRFGRFIKQLPANPRDSELRLRAWIVDRALSGDIITEQSIHAVDVATWILDSHPVSAYGTGGRKYWGQGEGDTWDHFSIIYTFPEKVLVTHAAGQFLQGYGDCLCRVYGPKGTLDTHYDGNVTLLLQKSSNGGRLTNLYEDGVVRNIATFHENITQNRFANPTVAPSVRSTLTTILGRTAAYRHVELSWEELMRSDERLDPGLHGLKE